MDHRDHQREGSHSAHAALYIRHKTGPVTGQENSHARGVMATVATPAA